MFALDTDVLFRNNDPQLEWLSRMLNEAREKTPNAWRFVVGHHPAVSGGEHGVKGHLEDYRKQLLPVLKAGAAHLYYVTGHDHDLQLLKIEGVYQMVSGGGGKDERKVKKVAESVFYRKGYGFAVVEATATELCLNYCRTKSHRSRCIRVRLPGTWRARSASCSAASRLRHSDGRCTC